ncbi:MAG: hypothetical protein KF691_04095 [Phycisphaeraceae bacterium]|nr:hypothetical protein [Phycisphaeraceae bacterium]
MTESIRGEGKHLARLLESLCLLSPSADGSRDHVVQILDVRDLVREIVAELRTEEGEQCGDIRTVIVGRRAPRIRGDKELTRESAVQLIFIGIASRSAGSALEIEIESESDRCTVAVQAGKAPAPDRERAAPGQDRSGDDRSRSRS